MDYYFYPPNESEFKKKAVGKFVRTIVFNRKTNLIESSFVRSVKKEWQQSCKNNIETDHRVKSLVGVDFDIYSWVVETENSFNLPNFVELKSL